ncbi:O-antigen ligase family protein [Mycobacterium sp.]|uniref:O-antigen ligase family protein n=1 Tax=Mycobacterium sp. TaxID=1785 RepID=UPI0025FCEE35|nr:O-antigen ligase family protein [Mycobacterium sp.]MBW0014542.1 O-antigen ligase family protein [Mycobacterium sp.]
MILYLRGRSRWAVAAVTLAVFLFGSFAVGVFSVRDTVYGMMLILAMFGLVVYWVKPDAMVGVALFWAFAALPAGLHVGKVVGPAVINGYQVAVVLAICYLIPIVRPRFSDFALPGIFALTVVSATVAGFAAGHTTWVVIRESQTLFEMIGGFILGLLIIHGDYGRLAIRAIVLILWFSAGMAIVSSLHAVQLFGRAESLPGAGAGDAVRIILSTQSLATAVLTALVAAALIGGVRHGLYFALGPPALIITMLSFSRNTLIALAVGAGVAVLAGFGWLTLRRGAALAAIGAVVFAVAIPGSLFLLQGTSSGDWLAGQFAAFNHRVLGGVSTEALSVDSSTQDRLREVGNLNRAIARAPVFGHGLGYAYQPSYGDDEFETKITSTFSHNFYLWWLVKAGAVGMAAFALFALAPLTRALRRASPPAKISAATTGGLLAISAVWPLPEMPIDALALGLALGATMGLAGVPRPSPDAGELERNGRPAPIAGLK